MKQETKSFKQFFKDIWTYIKNNWQHWVTLGLTLILGKLKDYLNKNKIENVSKVDSNKKVEDHEPIKDATKK